MVKVKGVVKGQFDKQKERADEKWRKPRLPTVKSSFLASVHSKARMCFLVVLMFLGVWESNLQMCVQNNVHMGVRVCVLWQRAAWGQSIEG